MFPVWAWLILAIGAAFLFLRAQHYWASRQTENHDTYLLARETCDQGRLRYRKCPDLDMWGFKWSVIIVLLAINTVFLIVLYSRQ